MLRRLTRTISIREAAAIIFALTAVLPVLVLLALLDRLDLLKRSETQVGLVLALLVAILGFVVFRRMVDQIAQLARAGGGARIAKLPALGTVAELLRIRRTLKGLLKDAGWSREHLKHLLVMLVALNEVAELAARMPRIPDFLNLALGRTMRTVNATIGSIMLVDGEGRTLRIAAARGLPDEVLDAEIKVGEGIAGKIAQLGVPVLVENIETDARFAKPNDPRYGSGSFISVPIRLGDRVIGVTNLAKKEVQAADSPDSHCFTAVDLRFVNALMTYVAYALEYARLLEETRHKEKKL